MKLKVFALLLTALTVASAGCGAKEDPAPQPPPPSQPNPNPNPSPTPSPDPGGLCGHIDLNPREGDTVLYIEWPSSDYFVGEVLDDFGYVKNIFFPDMGEEGEEMVLHSSLVSKERTCFEENQLQPGDDVLVNYSEIAEILIVFESNLALVMPRGSDEIQLIQLTNRPY